MKWKSYWYLSILMSISTSLWTTRPLNSRGLGGEIPNYWDFSRKIFRTISAHGLLLPQLESIPGYDLQDFDRNTELLRRIYNKINRSIRFLRDESGLSQREFANFFAIPVVPCKLGIKEAMVAQYIFIYLCAQSLVGNLLKISLESKNRLMRRIQLFIIFNAIFSTKTRKYAQN